MKTQCLYEICDVETGETYKYGITGEVPNQTGTYSRASKQVNQLNRQAGKTQYEAQILEENIPGRSKALELERQKVTEFKRRYGEQPRGNKLPKADRE